MPKTNRTYTLPSDVTTVTRSALKGVKNNRTIKRVIIPHGVTSIEERAFRDCKHLTSITIPDGVTEINDYTFDYCSKLTSINIPNSVTWIGQAAFDDCSKLTSITIPNSVTNIGARAFSRCKKLTSISLSNSITTIRRSTFDGCSSLTSITIPDDVTVIENYTFSNCSSLASIDIGKSVTSIGIWAFKNCTSITSINIPDTVTAIKDLAFNGCTSITSITIPNSITSIGIGAFRDCSNLNYIFIPDQLNNKDTNYWENIGIDLNRTHLITYSPVIYAWAKEMSLSSTLSLEEKTILYQLQKKDNFILSWAELGKIIPNVSMHDLLKTLPENKINHVLPSTYKKQQANKNLEHLSFFSFNLKSPEQEQDIDYLKKNDFEAYQDLSRPTNITQQLKKLGTNESNAILQWLSLKEVAGLLNIKASSTLKRKRMDDLKNDPVVTRKTRTIMQG